MHDLFLSSDSRFADPSLRRHCAENRPKAGPSMPIYPQIPLDLYALPAVKSCMQQ
jgi:hypothetical protein